MDLPFNGVGLGGNKSNKRQSESFPPSPASTEGPGCLACCCGTKDKETVQVSLTSHLPQGARGPGGQGGQATVKVGLQSRPMFLSIYTYLVRSRSMTNHTSDISGVQYTTRIYQLIFLVFNIQQGSISNQPMNIS